MKKEELNKCNCPWPACNKLTNCRLHSKSESSTEELKQNK